MSQLTTTRPSSHAHTLVKETAEAMCHELYDHMMQDNEWYRLWRSQHPGKSPKALEAIFVKKNLSRILPQARATMAKMLTTTQDPNVRDEIYDALLLDATLIRGR